MSVEDLEWALLKAKTESERRTRAHRATASQRQAEHMVSLERLKALLLGWRSDVAPGEPGGDDRNRPLVEGVVIVIAGSNGETGSTAELQAMAGNRAKGAVGQSCPPGAELTVFGPDLPVADPPETAIVLISRAGHISRARIRRLAGQLISDLPGGGSRLVAGVGRTVSSRVRPPRLLSGCVRRRPVCLVLRCRTGTFDRRRG